MLKEIEIVIGSKCNLDCYYCDKGELSYDFNKLNTLKAIKLFKDKGFPIIALTGGEPLLNADLLEYISFSKKIGFDKIRLNTNLSQPLNSDFLMRLSESGLSEIRFPMFSHDKESYAKVSGTDLWETCCENITELGKINSFELSADFMITDETADHIEDIVGFLKKSGIRRIFFKYPFSTKGYSQPGKIKEHSEALLSYLNNNPSFKDFHLVFFPSCLFPGFDDKIFDLDGLYLYDGSLFPLSKAILNQFRFNAECSECSMRQNCHGLDRSPNNDNIIFNPAIGISNR